MHDLVKYNIYFLCVQGEITGTAMLGIWWLCRKAPLPPRAMMAANALAGMALIQVCFKHRQ